MTSDGSDTTQPRIGIPPKLFRFALIIVIATVIGPLVGGVTVFLMFAAMLMAQPGFSFTGIGESFILMLGATYLAGWVIALTAGIIVVFAALWRQPTLGVVIAAVVVANVGYFAVTEPAVFYFTGGSPRPLQRLIVSIAFSAYAANVCWLLFRRFLTKPA